MDLGRSRRLAERLLGRRDGMEGSLTGPVRPLRACPHQNCATDPIAADIGGEMRTQP
jgi:hypothetical protein